MNKQEEKEVEESITLSEEFVLERCALIAEDPKNQDWVGGSTGSAIGTAKRIADAIRKLKL